MGQTGILSRFSGQGHASTTYVFMSFTHPHFLPVDFTLSHPLFSNGLAHVAGNAPVNLPWVWTLASALPLFVGV